MKIRKVRWQTPLGSYVSPYENRIALIRYFAYARLGAALKHAAGNPALRVLDFGCWAGHFLPSLAERFPEVWGVDDDSGSVIQQVPEYWTTLQLAQQLCRHELGDVSVRLIRATGSALPFPERCFDIVFCLDTLAHVLPAEKQVVISELKRITNPDGRLVFTLPIETGIPLLVRKGLRWLSRKHPCNYTYDFRSDLKLLQSNFRIASQKFWPSYLLSLAVIIDCRPENRVHSDTVSRL